MPNEIKLDLWLFPLEILWNPRLTISGYAAPVYVF